MPLRAELDAVKKNYVKLMKLPVKDLLPALKMADVVSDDQREQMNALTLDKDRAGYLIDKVIINSLKVDIREPFYNFLQVLEDDDNPVVKVIAKDLRAQLVPSMPPQPYGGSVHTPYQGHTPLQQYPPYQGQTPPQQYPPYQGHTPSQQYPPYQGQTPPQQYPPYQGQTPPQQYPPYQGQTSPQQYPPYQGQTPPQQYPSYQGQTPPLQYPPSQGQMPPRQPQGGTIPQPSENPAQMIKVENCLENASKGIDPLPANNRNVHAVCLISIKLPQGTMHGTGFIANFTMPNSSSPVTVLVTNHHVIHNLSEALEATYQFSYLRMDSDDIFSPVIKGKKLIPQNDHALYTSKERDVIMTDVLMDYTVIQVREEALNNIKIKSELDGEEFPLSECKFDLDNPTKDTKQMETICMLHYPRGQPLKRSAQGSISVGPLLFYACDTDEGSSGAPVFKVVNEKIKLIALHRGGWPGAEFNCGILMTEVIEHINGKPAPRLDHKDTNSKLLSIVDNC